MNPDKLEPPADDQGWSKNDSKQWPKVTYEDLVDYLIESKAYDGKKMKSFRALYGHNYVQSGWMGDIYSIFSGDIHFLKAKVSPSQPGVGRKDYLAWIAVSANCTVITGLCSCPAGEGRSCSHIAAVIYAVTLAWQHGVAGTTCTDKLVAWGRGATKSLTHEKLTDIDFSRTKPDAAPIIGEANRLNSTQGLPQIQAFLDHSDLQAHASNSAMSAMWNCKGTMLYKVLNCPELSAHTEATLTHLCHDIDSENPVTSVPCSTCGDFFNKYVNLSAEKMKFVEKSTRDQKTPMWLDSRKVRITSSRVHSLPKTNRADPNKLLNNLLYTRFKGCSATRHGQKYESVARQWFEGKTGKSVTQSGLCIHPTETYLAASPDGLVDNDTVIEIKCPTKNLTEMIASGKYDVIQKDGVPHLNPKGKNGYFYQVQFAMFCTGRKLCKFVLWTKEKGIILDIPYDSEFVNSVLPRVRKFYFEHLLVRLVDELHSKRLKLCKEYRQLCA